MDDPDPYGLRYEFSITERDRLQFRILKHIKKQKAKRKFLRRSRNV